ncbi:MAG TPA: mechanosensitive ion channel family protein [Candidatus Saccharimonadales bacterium]
MDRHFWRKAYLRLVPCAVLFVGGISLSFHYGNVRHGNFDHKLIALAGVSLFVVFSIASLHVLTSAVRKSIVAHRLGVGRAAALQFILRLFGYLAIMFTTLDGVGVPVGHLLLGSAVLGIILGVAAQQALGNFFASIVLIVSHPFVVGEELTLVSGALGGKYEGTIVDIGLTHTHLQEKNGTVVALPNATLLAGAAIVPEKPLV